MARKDKTNSGEADAQQDDVLETMEDAGEVLNYDPFAQPEPVASGESEPEPEPTPPAAEPASGEVAPPEAPPAAVPPQAAEPPAPPAPAAPEPPPVQVPVEPTPPPAPPQADPALSELLGIVRAQQEQIAQLNQRLGGAPGQPEAPPEYTGPPMPDYLFNVPDQILEAVRSDDLEVQRAAYANMISGMAKAVHQSMYGTLQEGLTPIIENRISDSRVEQDRRRNMHDDFYGTYKFLDNPQLKPMIAATAAQVSREWGTQEWSQQMRDEIYRRVVQTLQTVQGATQGGPPPPTPGPAVPAPGAPAPSPAVLGNQGAVPPAGQPPTILDSGVRPGLRSSGSIADEVEELLF